MKLKYDFTEEQLGVNNKIDLAKNLSDLEKLCANLDAVILTSKDPFMSEYVPLANNPRFGVTGFTGSVGDAIYWTENYRKSHPNQKPVSVFVDGRYHLQVDQECPAELVEAIKITVEPSMEGALQERLFSSGAKQVGMDFQRTSISVLNQRREKAKGSGVTLHSMVGDDMLKAVHLSGWKTDRPIFSLPEEMTGRTLAHNLEGLAYEIKAAFSADDVLHMTAATDDAAFLLNARGYHLPYVGSFLAYTFFIQNEFILFLPASSEQSKVEIEPSQVGSYQLTVIRNDFNALKMALKKHTAKKIAYFGPTMNGFLPTLASEVFPEAEIESSFNWVLRSRTRKTPQELASIRECFLKSSRAIAKALRWGKTESQKRNVSEVDLAEYLKDQYGAEGATTLSFNTISGAGPNSAIVHYGTPSKTNYFEKGMIALLDSGACYSNGFLTDCTRGFFVGSQNGASPEAWQKEIYTSTLKAAIQVFMAPVSKDISCKEVDMIIREQVKASGYDYMHGTGHGIGIHVHEDGIRLSTLSSYAQTPYACVSVEPGIYLAGKGGVRVENVALLIPHDENKLRYENVVFVGYDWDLIDISKLTGEEMIYLKEYEAKCREMGNQLMDCPL